MRERKWKDCPSCNSIGTMKLKKNAKETFNIKKYQPITISDIEGYFCSNCGKGIYTIRAKKKIKSLLALEKAKQDSLRVVAADLMDIGYISKKLGVSIQRVYQMMNEGKIDYVFVGKNRFPIKIDDATLNELKKKVRTRKK